MVRPDIRLRISDGWAAVGPRWGRVPTRRHQGCRGLPARRGRRRIRSRFGVRALCRWPFGRDAGECGRRGRPGPPRWWPAAVVWGVRPLGGGLAPHDRAGMALCGECGLWGRPGSPPWCRDGVAWGVWPLGAAGIPTIVPGWRCVGSAASGGGGDPHAADGMVLCGACGRRGRRNSPRSVAEGVTWGARPLGAA
jgi:hypothetical protein